MLRRVGYVIVFVRNMDSTLNFWVNKLGLQARYSSEEWSEIELENLVIGLHRSGETVPRDTGIVFETGNIEALVSELRRRGVDVSEPRDIGVGLEATFKDPEGNIYRIFQPSK